MTVKEDRMTTAAAAAATVTEEHFIPRNDMQGEFV